MNVLILSKEDWANVGYSLECALKSVGVTAVSLGEKPHGYKYTNRSRICKNSKELKNYAEKADILQFMHSTNINLGIGNQFDGRKGIAVFHGGGTYRAATSHYNNFWNSKAQATLIQTGDLLDKGDPKVKNQIWFLPPIDVDTLQPVYNRRTEKRLIMHCPSIPNRKGASEFNKLMNRLSGDPLLSGKFVYEYGSNVPWSSNIKRVKRCDIYFDACCPILGGKPYGEWGISALEACSLGKVVVSHFLSVERYKREFGKECAIQHANNMREVEQQMRRLILMPPDEFDNLRRGARQWVEENHSFPVIGQRLVDIYNKHLTWEGK